MERKLVEFIYCESFQVARGALSYRVHEGDKIRPVPGLYSLLSDVKKYANLEV